MQRLAAIAFLSLIICFPAFPQEGAVIQCDPNTKEVPSWTSPGSGDVVEQLSCGQAVSILALEKGYFKIQLGNRFAYVFAKYVQIQQGILSQPTAQSENSVGVSRKNIGSERFGVFLTAPMRDGFVDTNKDIQDSIKDIGKRLNGMKEIILMDTEEEADIVLTVVSRGSGVEEYGQRLSYKEYYRSAVLDSTPITSSTLWITTVMRVGDYRKEFTGVSTSIPDVKWALWRDCAKKIANDLQSWIRANSAQLMRLRLVR